MNSSDNKVEAIPVPDYQPVLNARYHNLRKFPEYFTHSGKSLISKLSPEDRIIDVGCGRNYFRLKFPNVYGIDPAHALADEKVTIEEFVTDKKFNVALCLGSLGHGTEADFYARVKKVVSLLEPRARIYFRVFTPHYTRDLSEVPVPVYIWPFELVYQYAAEFGFQVINMLPELCQDGFYRTYVEWRRD